METESSGLPDTGTHFPDQQPEGESECDTEDLSRIAKASNVIYFLSQFIHNVSCGRSDRVKVELHLTNARDQFDALKHPTPATQESEWKGFLEDLMLNMDRPGGMKRLKENWIVTRNK